MIERLILAALVSLHSATLSWKWTANADKATAFSIQRAATEVGPFTQLATVSTSTFTYIDKAIRAKNTYCYQIIAVAKHGASSPPSNIACVVIP